MKYEQLQAKTYIALKLHGLERIHLINTGLVKLKQIKM